MINLCKLDSRWCECTLDRSGHSHFWSQTTGSCLRRRSRTCSWTSSLCHVTRHCANSTTSLNAPVLPRSVLLSLYHFASSSVGLSGMFEISIMPEIKLLHGREMLDWKTCINILVSFLVSPLRPVPQILRRRTIIHTKKVLLSATWLVFSF